MFLVLKILESRRGDTTNSMMHSRIKLRLQSGEREKKLWKHSLGDNFDTTIGDSLKEVCFLFNLCTILLMHKLN